MGTYHDRAANLTGFLGPDGAFSSVFGAKRQPPEARKRFPGVDWERLDEFSDDNETGTWGWPQPPTPEEIWKFIHEEAPILVEKLR